MSNILRLRQIASGKVNYRWQSSQGKAKTSGSSKYVQGFLWTSVLGFGGVIAYANYDRVFKVRVDQSIPGFAKLVDRVGEKWNNATNYFRRQPKAPERDLVYKSSQPKPKPDIGKILKRESGPPDKTGEKIKEHVRKRASTEDDFSSEVKNSSESKGDKVTAESDDLLNTKDVSKVVMVVEQVASEAGSGEPIVEDKSDKSKTSIDSTKEHEITKEEVTSGDVKSDKEREDLAHVSTVEENMPVKKDSTTDQGSSSEAKSSNDEVVSVITSRETKPISEKLAPKGSLPESPVGVDKDPKLSDPSKSEELLEDAYKEFLFGCDEVSKAQEQVKQAWLELHAKVAASADVEGGVEQQIAEAKQASLEASNILKKAVDKYKERSSYADRMVKHAQDSGYGTKASTIAAEIQLKEAEIDLNLILVKEVIATARLAASCHGVINKSREELQRDLETVSSSIDPSNKDKIIASLSKKLEILDQKLKAVDAEHSRNVIIALEVQRNELKELSEKKLEHSLEERDAKHNLESIVERKRQADKYRKAIVEQMRAAHEAYQEEKEKALEQLSKNMSAWWTSQLDEQLATQATLYQLDLAKTQSRLAGVERMIDSVADAGERTIRFQSLRKFCDSLVGSMERINSDMDYDVRRYVLGTDIESIRKSAHDDSFVMATLNSIPPQAVEGGGGIQSERQIKARFDKVRRTCRSVALVPPEGAGPFTYFLSYVQSVLTFRRVPLPEVVGYPELEKMDTYAILYLAEKRMAAGDLAGVVDCMAFLKGEPQRIASDWLEDARLYLETLQAVELLQTYMRSKTFY